jgi:hypothetical protein
MVAEVRMKAVVVGVVLAMTGVAGRRAQTTAKGPVADAVRATRQSRPRSWAASGISTSTTARS